MFSLETYLTFLVAAILLAVSPGPSNLYIMARSMAQGHQAGYAAAIGMAGGSVVYVIATVLGLAAILAYSPMAYAILKFAGAAYLIYLGLSYFRQPPSEMPVTVKKERFTTATLLKQSFMVEITNPKTALFFLAFLPQFVDPDGNAALQLFVLGLSYTVIGFISDLMFATLSGKLGNWLKHHRWFIDWQDRLSGSILIGLGGYILYQQYTESH